MSTSALTSKKSLVILLAIIALSFIVYSSTSVFHADLIRQEDTPLRWIGLVNRTNTQPNVATLTVLFPSTTSSKKDNRGDNASIADEDEKAGGEDLVDENLEDVNETENDDGDGDEDLEDGSESREDDYYSDEDKGEIWRLGDILPEEALPFLKTFKNPCWFNQNGDLSCLPYAYLAGFPKCGTTDMFRKLVEHPDIVSNTPKEPHFWTRRRHPGVNSKPWSLERYTRRVYGKATSSIMKSTRQENDEAVHYRIIVDGSASTMWDNRQWNRFEENKNATEPQFLIANMIHTITPKARIICMLRNPVDRLYSDYLYFKTKGIGHEDFHKRVTNGITYFNECMQRNSLRWCAYSNRKKYGVRLLIGLYHVFIADWMRIFPKEQIHVVRLEDHYKDPVTSLSSVYDFLNLRELPEQDLEDIAHQPASNTRRKSKAKLGSMLPETRKILQDFYYEHNKQLAILLGDDKYLWKD